MFRHYLRTYDIIMKYDGLKSYKTTFKNLFGGNYKDLKLNSVCIPPEEDLVIDLCFLGVTYQGKFNYLYITTKPDCVTKYYLQKGVYY